MGEKSAQGARSEVEWAVEQRTFSLGTLHKNSKNLSTLKFTKLTSIMKLIHFLIPSVCSQITCSPDSEDPTCLSCSEIPQDLEGLDTYDFSSYSPVVKLKLKLEKDDPNLDEDLVELDVENRLKSVLQNLSHLEELFLVRFNGMVNNRILKHSSSLKQLNLIKTNITSLPANLLKDTNIETLIIKESEMDSIDAATFNNQNTLRTLKINKSNIHNITSRSFIYLENLEKLDLSDNNIDSIEKTFLKPLTNLRVIELENNGLSVLDPKVFKFNRNLTKVNLHGNSLDTLECDLLKFQVNLKSLNISSNYLTKLPCNIIHRQGVHLKELDMSGNNLHKRWNKLLAHEKRGTGHVVRKRMIKAEMGKSEEAKEENICLVCEKNLPTRKTLKEKWENEV